MSEEIKYPKADPLKRFVAFLIDYIIAGFLSVIPFIGGLAGTAYFLLRDGLDWEFMKHRSIGKTLLKLKLIVLEGERKEADLTTSVHRNWIFAIPVAVMIVPVIGVLLSLLSGIFIYIMEGLKVINEPDGRRVGDTFADTIVIEEEKEAEAVIEQPSPYSEDDKVDKS